MDQLYGEFKNCMLSETKLTYPSKQFFSDTFQSSNSGIDSKRIRKTSNWKVRSFEISDLMFKSSTFSLYQGMKSGWYRRHNSWEGRPETKSSRVKSCESDGGKPK